jgi:hypothetical protein
MSKSIRSITQENVADLEAGAVNDFQNCCEQK